MRIRCAACGAGSFRHRRRTKPPRLQRRGREQIGVIIAFAGKAAHSRAQCGKRRVPVIGYPSVEKTSAGGRDASSVQLPKACRCNRWDDGAANAALLAVRILALSMRSGPELKLYGKSTRAVANGEPCKRAGTALILRQNFAIMNQTERCQRRQEHMKMMEQIYERKAKGVCTDDRRSSSGL
jgi:hypothetical protein